MTLRQLLVLAAAACGVVSILAFTGLLSTDGHAWLAGALTGYLLSLLLVDAPR